MDLQSMFDHLVDLTELICQRIDKRKASMVLFDTSGIEAWVTENNPKYANQIIKQLKAFKKANGLDDSFDPYKTAYGSMSSHAASNPPIQQMYINRHFCYAYKFDIVTNGLGIVRHISFYNKGFLKSHPEIIVEKIRLPGRAQEPCEFQNAGPDTERFLSDTPAHQSQNISRRRRLRFR